MPPTLVFQNRILFICLLFFFFSHLVSLNNRCRLKRPRARARARVHSPTYKQTDRKYAFHLGGTTVKGTGRKNDGAPRKKHKFNLKNGCKRTLVGFVSERTKTSRTNSDQT